MTVPVPEDGYAKTSYIDSFTLLREARIGAVSERIRTIFFVRAIRLRNRASGPHRKAR